MNSKSRNRDAVVVHEYTAKGKHMSIFSTSGKLKLLLSEIFVRPSLLIQSNWGFFFGTK